MNLYERAINKNEIIPFFRGEGEYYDLNRDWGGHDKAFTQMHIIGYGTEFGEKRLYDQLEKDLSKYLNIQDFNFYDFQLIIGIFWFYALYRFDENKLKVDWSIPVNISEQLKVKYAQFSDGKEDISTIDRVLSNLNQRYNLKLW